MKHATRPVKLMPSLAGISVVLSSGYMSATVVSACNCHGKDQQFKSGRRYSIHLAVEMSIWFLLWNWTWATSPFIEVTSQGTTTISLDALWLDILYVFILSRNKFQKYSLATYSSPKQFYYFSFCKTHIAWPLLQHICMLITQACPFLF